MTQNEKDRKIVNQALVVCKIAKANGVKDDNTIALVIELANRLLTERENAETVYKFSGKVPNMFSLGERQIIWGDVDGTNMKLPVEEGQQGVWIPVEEA
ncbi:hypothetical protein HB825_05500 [Listeria booriae]|uniref:hypothetical protein n=1 Tax=Listeria booriae TaxID=1552123 RepID=UPI00164E5E99|nr:hypothetical protein [Listeria booriae]MBC6134292.1 hypothetical protein [Listeria booriae]